MIIDMKKRLTPETFKFDINTHGFKTDPISVVVPNQAMTLRELINKHIEGQILNVTRDAVNLENQDFDSDNIVTKVDFDLTDMDIMKEKLKTLNSQIKELKAKKASEEKAKKAQEEEIIREAKKASEKVDPKQVVN